MENGSDSGSYERISEDLSTDKGRKPLENGLELGDTPLPEKPVPGPVLLELRINTQCHPPPKRSVIAVTPINHLMLALYSEGQMKPHQIKYALENVIRYWTRVDRNDEELPMIEWDPEPDDIFICTECNSMMYIQLLDDDDGRPKYCPRCRGVDTLVPAEPDNELSRPVLRLIPGGRRDDCGGKHG